LTNREILSINVLFDDNAQPREFNIGGHLNPDTYFSPIESGLRNIKEIYFASDYLHKQSAEPVIYDIALYIEEPSQRRALAMVKELTRGQLNLKRISSIEVREEFENIRIILFALGGGISIILLVIGILNFINIITTSILSRRREIALLESIGQSKKQTIAILTLEGAIYAALTFLFSGIFGGAFTYAIYSALAKQFDYVIFNLPLIPLSVMACAALLICLGLPGLAFRSVSGLTLVERLREAE
ncbi:MAG: ABC transporter permease, partial [Treponema sp.]|nr:ABC transporter permease [Treponema sp.]